MPDIYLDNNATTQVSEPVIEAMNHCFRTAYGNASSVHRLGNDADRFLTDSRHTLAGLLGVSDDWVVFTSGGTEGNNSAIKGLARANRNRGDHLVTTAIEHPSVLEPMAQLETEGFRVTRVAPDFDGRVRAEDLLAAVTDETILVSIMHVNNETGAIQPVFEIARAVKQENRRLLVHSDGVQAFGKLLYGLRDLDAYTVSAHKLHGPKGVGALLLRPGLRMEPLLAGGGHEQGLRSGTENVPGIVGMAQAARLAYEDFEESLSSLRHNKERLLEGLRLLPDVSIHTAADSVSNTVMASFAPVPGEVLVNAFSEEGVYVSTGAACSNRKDTRSHVLAAMGAPEADIESSIRFSLSRDTTAAEIDRTLEILNRMLPRLRRVAARQVS